MHCFFIPQIRYCNAVSLPCCVQKDQSGKYPPVGCGSGGILLLFKTYVFGCRMDHGQAIFTE